MINRNWISYLRELKSRVLICLSVFIILFTILFIFHKPVFYWIALPLLKHLPHDGRMIAINITSPFMVPLQMAWFGAFLLGMPLYLWQLWQFVMPALHGPERKFLWPLLFLSVLLFGLGVLFAYFIFLPLAFNFLIGFTPSTVQVMTDMSAYLDFVIKFTLSFGFSFEIPVVILLLTHSGITTVQSLTKKRSYMIVVAFVLGMLLTPPDVISQILLALPLWGLFELGILLAKFNIKRKYDEKTGLSA